MWYCPYTLDGVIRVPYYWNGQTSNRMSTDACVSCLSKNTTEGEFPNKFSDIANIPRLLSMCPYILLYYVHNIMLWAPSVLFYYFARVQKHDPNRLSETDNVAFYFFFLMRRRARFLLFIRNRILCWNLSCAVFVVGLLIFFLR